jgi:hypothetical protein
MSYFETVPFLQIGDQEISLQQGLGYMQLCGKLQALLREVVIQHVVLQEIQARQDLQVSATDIEQAILDFRIRRQLSDSVQVQTWLDQQRITYNTFRSQVAYNLKLRKLRAAIAAPNLQSYFDNNGKSLEQLQLSYLVTPEQMVAERLKQQCLEADSSFEAIAKKYESGPGATVKFSGGLVQRDSLPVEVRDPLESAPVGEVVGPLLLNVASGSESSWGVFRIEQIIPATLDDSLKQQLENRLFLQWLAEKVNPLKVEFASGQTDLGASHEDLNPPQEDLNFDQKDLPTDQTMSVEPAKDALTGQ